MNNDEEWKKLYEYELENIKSSKIWDANIIGPVVFCIFCFHELKDYPTYCTYCGHVSMIFKAPNDVRKQNWCYKHTNKTAVGWCALCAKSICEVCDNKGKKPSEYFDYTVNLKCKDCVKRIKVLETEYNNHLKKSGSCCRHEDIKAVYRCKVCNSSLCTNCAYSSELTKGSIFKKIEIDGPFCLPCLRTDKVKKARSSKFNWLQYTP